MTTAKYSYAHADQPLLNEVRLSFQAQLSAATITVAAADWRRQGSKTQRPIGLFWLALGAPYTPPPSPSLPRGCKAVYALVYSSSAKQTTTTTPSRATAAAATATAARDLSLFCRIIPFAWNTAIHTTPHSTHITLSKCIHTYETAQDIN